MVEAGISYNDILGKCNQNNIDLSSVNSVLVTHSHKDHCKSVLDLENRGMTIYASKPTIEATGLRNAIELANGRQTIIDDSINVIPFEVIHDCDGSLGFYIQQGDDSIIFINDCYKVDFDLKCFAPELVFIECNHEDQSTHIAYSNAVKSGDYISKKRYERILKSHLGVYGCKKILTHIDLTRCKSIMLMHLSDNTSNEYRMKEEIGRFTDIPTYVCGKNGGIK